MTTRRSCSRWVSRSIIRRASPRGGGVLGRSGGSGCGSRRRRGPGTRGSFWDAGRGGRRRPSATRRWCDGDPSLALDLAWSGWWKGLGTWNAAGRALSLDIPGPEARVPADDEPFDGAIHVLAVDIADEGEFGAVAVEEPEDEARRVRERAREAQIEERGGDAGLVVEGALEFRVDLPLRGGQRAGFAWAFHRGCSMTRRTMVTKPKSVTSGMRHSEPSR